MLIGHDKILEKLKSDVENGSLHHAHLFIGPEHVGKTKLALTLTVHMQGAEGNVIAKKQILEGADADTIFLLDEGVTGKASEPLPIKSIREIVARTGQTHNKAHLVFVIENIGRMRPEAMNALLKTLEEPPEGVVFFLTANSDEVVLPTIRSRCNVTNFHTVSDAIMRGACQENVNEEQLIMFAMGRPGKLRRLMDEADYFAAHQELNHDLTQCLEDPTTHRAFNLVRKYEKHALRAEMLDIFLHRIRTFALAQKSPLVLQHLDFTALMDKIEQAKRELTANVNARLLLEDLFLALVN